jgi:hypothetical protein
VREDSPNPYCDDQDRTMRSTCRAEHEQEANAGALAFKRTGDLNTGSFDDATILRTFGVIPQNLDEL